jgi:hypothetical protein
VLEGTLADRLMAGTVMVLILLGAGAASWVFLR